ncbi:MAG: sulfate permease, partial [Vicinamibacteraceae bacterium]|nr:sulfate permease [Vicinamibacteraceae bacterium]
MSLPAPEEPEQPSQHPIGPARFTIPPRLEPWLPKIVVTLRDYDRPTFAADSVAGVTVGLVALPLAMAFAIASGLPPQAGIYCAIVTGFLVSLLGGTKTLIGGPTGAFVVVVADIVARHGIDGLFMCTMMAGVLLVFMGATGMGAAVKFIPRPVVVGFTNGIAVLIASTQIKDFFGLTLAQVPSEFLERMEALAGAAPTWSPQATALGIAALVVIIVSTRFGPRVPGAVVAMVVGTAAVALGGMDVETIGTRYGGIPSTLPTLDVPSFRPDLIFSLVSPAFTVAMLGAIESLMAAVVADRMTGDRHNPNVELIGQGVANVVSPLFGGLPATGAIARTATNVKAGGRTPVAGIVHAVTLLVVVLVAAPLASHIPLAVLSAILFVVAYNMGEWGEIPQLLKLTKADILVWLVTFTLTVMADLTIAVEVGMVLAALLFIRRVADTTTVELVTERYVEEGRLHTLQDKDLPPYVAIYRIHGPFLFGSTDKIERVLADLPTLPPIVVLRLRNMTALDATGVAAIEEVAEKLHESGRTLLVCGARRQPAALIEKSDLRERLGEENVLPHVAAAVERAKVIYGREMDMRA